MKELCATLLIHLIETIAPLLVALGIPLSLMYVFGKYF